MTWHHRKLIVGEVAAVIASRLDLGRRFFVPNRLFYNLSHLAWRQCKPFTPRRAELTDAGVNGRGA